MVLTRQWHYCDGIDVDAQIQKVCVAAQRQRPRSVQRYVNSYIYRSLKLQFLCGFAQDGYGHRHAWDVALDAHVEEDSQHHILIQHYMLHPLYINVELGGRRSLDSLGRQCVLHSRLF